MHIGTVLTVISVVTLIGAAVWVFQDEDAQETLELSRAARESMPTLSQEEVDLRRQGQFYGETYNIFMMDDELDEGECNTLSGIAEPLADRIANAGATDLDYAEHLGGVIERVEETCQ